MGASASVNKQTVQNNMIDSATANCGAGASATNIINVSNTNYTQPPNCPAGSLGFNAGQAAVVDSTCLLGNLQSNAANVAQNLSAKSQAGLGFSVGANVSETKNNLGTYVSQTCAGQSTTDIVDVSNVNVQACNFTVTQHASVNAMCQINNTQDQIGKIAVASAAQAQGGSIFGDLFGNLFTGARGIIIIVVIFLVLVLIVGGLIMFLLKTSETSKEAVKVVGENPDILKALAVMGGFWDSDSDGESFGDMLGRNKIWIIIIIIVLILLILFMLGASKAKDTKLTESDVNDFRQRIAEAQKIAGIAPTPTVSPRPSTRTSPNNSDTRPYDTSYYADDIFLSPNSLDVYYQPPLMQ